MSLGRGANVQTLGKGRKERRTPLVRARSGSSRRGFASGEELTADPLFPTSTGRCLSRDAVERRLAHRVALAGTSCPSITAKRVTPHVLRHSTAMRLLHAGIDTSVIALWLGHESIQTTLIYLRADLELKQRALDRTTPPGGRPGRYQPPDQLLAFLDSL